ncbi:MAG: choice-of-anchor D domain-containing protein [Calditrichia bacterium]
MRRFFTLSAYLLMLIVSIPLFAAERGVIKAIPTPSFPYGLTYDGTYLWVGCSSSQGDDKLWKLDPADGTIVGSIPVPDANGSYTVKALAFDGQNLWVFEDLPSSSHPDKIYKVDPANGNILKTISAPTNNYIGGMTYLDDHLWISNYYGTTPEGIIVKLDTNGVNLGNIVTQGEQPMGVATDGQFIWCAEDSGFGNTRDEIYQYDPVAQTYTGTFIRNPSTRPRDMTWDGQYLWLVNYGANELYQISLEGGTPDINLPVSSLDFGLVSVGDTATQTLNIQNVGTDTLTITGMTFNNTAFFSNIPSFPVIIPEGSGLAVQVSFAPQNVGQTIGLLSIDSDDPDEPMVTVDLAGQGQYVAPTIWLSAYYHDFGNVWIPTEGKAKWTLKIANTGNQNLEIVDLLLDDQVFTLGGFSSFPINIVPNDTFDLMVYFQPQDTVLYEDSLAIASTDTANPFVFVELQGRGYMPDYVSGYEFWHYDVPANPYGSSFQDFEVDGLKPLGDINGDGVSEVVIATENYWLLCLDGAGSGVTDTVWSFSTYISNYSAGSIGANSDYGVQDAISTDADLNNDGIKDVVIGTGGGNEHVYAVNGKTGEMLWTFGTDDPNSYSMGDFQAVDVKRDFNGDQVNDVLAIADGSETNNGGYHSAYLFDGTNGNMIWSYTYPGPNLSFGKSIISMEDLTGDGVPEAMINVSNNNSGNTDKKTYCIDGAYGTPVWDQIAVNNGPKELLELPVPGETPDVIVGEYFADVRRLDGETGAVVWYTTVGVGYAGIIQMNLISDINNDGFDDILFATFTGAVSCLSGADGSYLWSFAAEFQYGITAVPDLNNDGFDDVVVGGGTNNPDTGFLYVLSGKGDMTLMTKTYSGDRINAVAVMPSIDGNDSYEILASTNNGQVYCYSGGLTASSISGNENNLPAGFELLQNYPNPFNPETRISFTLPGQSRVTARVYNVIGQQVATLLNNRSLLPGSHELTFNAGSLPSGMYLLRIESDFGVRTRKMMLMK